MNELVLASAAALGIGGAALMDAWGLVARLAFGIQGLDYALLGRWIGHGDEMRSGLGANLRTNST